MTRFLKALVIILAFSAAHALGCYFLHDTKAGDGLVLTVLTIAMVYALIRFYHAPFDVFLATAFLSCFAGFYLGTKGAVWLGRLLHLEGIWNNVLATALVTLVLGLVLVVLLRKTWRRRAKSR